jgi:hypothetical protein
MTAMTTERRAVVVHRTCTGHCPGCGKAAHLHREFAGHVGDLDGRGRPMTALEVLDAVHAAADAWSPDLERYRCPTCY